MVTGEAAVETAMREEVLQVQALLALALLLVIFCNGEEDWPCIIHLACELVM